MIDTINEEAVVQERLVLKSAVVARVARRYADFVAAVEAGAGADELARKEAVLCAELDEFERCAAHMAELARSEHADIAAAADARTAADARVEAAATALDALQQQLAQERAATRNKEASARLASEIARHPPVDALNAEIAALQRDLDAAARRAQRLERRLRVRQQQLAPLQAAAERLQAAANVDDAGATSSVPQDDCDSTAMS